MTPLRRTDVHSAAKVDASARQIDDVDRALVALLVEDARTPFAELAERCHIARSTAHARVDQLRRSGAITGFSAQVDPAAFGLGICALVFIRIRQHDWRQARDAIIAVNGVESLFMCTGDYDMVAIVRCRDVAEFRDVLLVDLHALDDVTGTETTFVLDEAHRTLAL